MSVFISTTNIAPFNPVDFDRITNNIIINSTENTDSKTFEDVLYLIVTSGTYDTIEIKVENELSSGASLYISPVDGVGIPTHWGKQIILNDIIIDQTNVIVPFKYKWVVINNIYILKTQKIAGYLNVYKIG